MSRTSEGGRISWATVGGRKVKLYFAEPENGIQSVNVCTRRNQDGLYREVFYFAKKFRVTAEELGRYGNLQTMIADLRDRSYRQSREV